MESNQDIDLKQGVEKRPRRSAIVLSALVFPGAGQIVQRRWLAGVAFAGLFTAAFLACLLFFFRIILAFYSLGFEFRQYEPGRLPIAAAVITFGIALLIYAVNLADVYAAYRRASSAWARKSFAERNPEMM